ncbi:ATP-binding protein [Oleiagrimonas sp. C23AA]|uniref:sensor histidine kinase n=1 Tax=Oleiagrimonas sp. C23AA TaxID=2719047 RepID=UPI0031B69170
MTSVAPGQEQESLVRRRPSLRRRLLLYLLVPMLALLLVDAVVTYAVSLAYSNRVHDRDLADDAVTLATMLRTQSPHGDISSQARFLLEYDPDGRDYFSIRSSNRGLIAGSRHLPPAGKPALPGSPPRLYDVRLNHTPLRAARLAVLDPNNRHDILQITVAESLHSRHVVARQILLMSIPLQLGLIGALLALVWIGVRYGLRVIEPLTAKLARREHDLSPIDDHDVPVELLPLTRTIDALFARLREVLAQQERFIADAAHQLRTPLAGLRLQAERAARFAIDPRAVDALQHIERLTERAARASAQLLSLTRAQSRPRELQALDLGILLPAWVGQRVYDAIAQNIDLGLETTDEPAWLLGDTHGLEEALNNLIDNALRHTPSGGTVTVGLGADSPDWLSLRVDDSGPGVPDELLPRLGERFFRAPDAAEGGTGLGLAIVQRITDKHGGTLQFSRSTLGGLAVIMRLPRLHAGETTGTSVVTHANA